MIKSNSNNSDCAQLLVKHFSILATMSSTALEPEGNASESARLSTPFI